MSQHDMTIANQGFPAFRSDLNDSLQALASTSSGATAPATTFANQLWYDTANNKLKIRDEVNAAWIEIVSLDQTNGRVAQFLGNSSDTVSAPSFTWGGDPNTGFYNPAADTIGVSTGGAERIRINSSGNVGIGTNAPAYKLDVNGGVNNTYMRITGDSSDAFYGMDTVGVYCGTTSATKPVRFLTNSTEAARIDSSGNLLVGRSSTTWNGNYNGAGGSITLSGGASITLSSSVCGSAIVSIYAEGSGNGGLFWLNYSSTAVKITGDGEATDTGGDFAVYKSAGSHTSTLKNKSGSSQIFRVNVLAGRFIA